MKSIYLVLAITALSLAVFGQSKPTFKQNSVRVELIRNISVDLKSHRTARMFRTNLRNAAAKGVNFAGHYVLTGWGCGTNCSEWAIIDGRNGRVYFPKELQGAGLGFCELPENGLPVDSPKEDEDVGLLHFKSNSKLLVLTGMTAGGLDNPRSGCGNYYFAWTGSLLKQIRFIKGKRINP